MVGFRMEQGYSARRSARFLVFLVFLWFTVIGKEDLLIIASSPPHINSTQKMAELMCLVLVVLVEQGVPLSVEVGHGVFPNIQLGYNFIHRVQFSSNFFCCLFASLFR